jgi:metal-responsive CopG/Arc/MetJ family transcriptional regulator
MLTVFSVSMPATVAKTITRAARQERVSRSAFIARVAEAAAIKTLTPTPKPEQDAA